MKALIQRVSEASVDVSGRTVGKIDKGILVFLGVERGDDEASALCLLNRVLDYRIFADESGRMNLSLRDTGGALLVVSQFTLAANTKKGRRPSFSEAASPVLAEDLYNYFVAQSGCQGVLTQSGQFGSDMSVSLKNDGPVTFLLEV